MYIFKLELEYGSIEQNVFLLKWLYLLVQVQSA